jgi:hypothetical protein
VARNAIVDYLENPDKHVRKRERAVPQKHLESACEWIFCKSDLPDLHYLCKSFGPPIEFVHYLIIAAALQRLKIPMSDDAELSIDLHGLIEDISAKERNNAANAPDATHATTTATTWPAAAYARSTILTWNATSPGTSFISGVFGSFKITSKPGEAGLETFKGRTSKKYSAIGFRD